MGPKPRKDGNALLQIDQWTNIKSHKVAKRVCIQIGVGCAASLLTLFLAFLNHLRWTVILFLAIAVGLWMAQLFSPDVYAGNTYSWFLFALALWIWWLFAGFVWGHDMQSRLPPDELSPWVGTRHWPIVTLVDVTLPLFSTSLCAFALYKIVPLKFVLFWLVLLAISIAPPSEDIFLQRTGVVPVLSCVFRPVVYLSTVIFFYNFREEEPVRVAGSSKAMYAQLRAFTIQDATCVLIPAYILVSAWWISVPCLAISVSLYIHLVYTVRNRVVEHMGNGGMTDKRLCDCISSEESGSTVQETRSTERHGPTKAEVTRRSSYPPMQQDTTPITVMEATSSVHSVRDECMDVSSRHERPHRTEHPRPSMQPAHGPHAPPHAGRPPPAPVPRSSPSHPPEEPSMSPYAPNTAYATHSGGSLHKPPMYNEKSHSYRAFPAEQLMMTPHGHASALVEAPQEQVPMEPYYARGAAMEEEYDDRYHGEYDVGQDDFAVDVGSEEEEYSEEPYYESDREF